MNPIQTKKPGFFQRIARAIKGEKHDAPKRTTSEIDGNIVRKRKPLSYFNRFKGQAGNKLYRRMRRRRSHGVLMLLSQAPEAKAERRKQRRKVRKLAARGYGYIAPPPKKIKPLPDVRDGIDPQAAAQ